MPPIAWKAPGCKCDSLEEHQTQSIMAASWAGDFDRLKTLLFEGIPFDIEFHGNLDKPDGVCFHGNETGYTPLQAAVYNEFTECVKLLIENGADVNRPIPEGYIARAGQSPLHIALPGNMRQARTAKSLEIVRILLESGASDPDILWHINRIASDSSRPDLKNTLLDLGILELLFANMSIKAIEHLVPRITVFGQMPPWSEEALKLLEFHKGRRVRNLEEKNMTFALSLHPRSAEHGAKSSVIDQDIAWRIMEIVCPERNANGRRKV
jgi:hypothetical protein